MKETPEQEAVRVYEERAAAAAVRMRESMRSAWKVYEQTINAAKKERDRVLGEYFR